GVGHAVVCLDTKNPMPHLDVISGLTTENVPSEIRAQPRPASGEDPALVTPRRTRVTTHIQAGPVVTEDRRATVLDAAPLLRAELVAQTSVDTDALDHVADAIVDSGVAKPSSVTQHGGRTQCELAVGAYSA